MNNGGQDPNTPSSMQIAAIPSIVSPEAYAQNRARFNQLKATLEDLEVFNEEGYHRYRELEQTLNQRIQDGVEAQYVSYFDVMPLFSFTKHTQTEISRVTQRRFSGVVCESSRHALEVTNCLYNTNRNSLPFVNTSGNNPYSGIPQRPSIESNIPSASQATYVRVFNI